MQEQKRKPIEPRRMEVWYAKLDRRDGSSVQGGSRPVLILSNDINNAVSSVVTVLPMTSRPKKLDLPSHTWIDENGIEGFQTGALILAEQITTIDQNRLVYRMGELKDKTLITLVENSVDAQLGMEKTMKTREEYLDGLPKWDGVKRIDTMLRDYLGAADRKYVREVSREMMLSAVSKTMDECHVVTLTPLLVGPSRIGKSTFLQRLCGGYCDGLNSRPTTGMVRNMTGNLLLEVNELSREVFEMIRYDHPFLIVITYNVMPVITGNHRICPVHVGRTDSGRAFVMDQEEADQLWAEAMDAYKRGERPKDRICDIHGMKEETKPMPKKYPYGIE